MSTDQQHFESVLECISRGSAADIKILLASLRPSEIAGGDVLTTITDVAGFSSFWGFPAGYICSPEELRLGHLMRSSLLTCHHHGFEQHAGG